jgi:peptidoglycan/LPS O-acetylase OafA/YrhL
MFSNLKFLDSFRGLAALYVVVGHARWLLWEGFSGGYLKHPEQYSVLGKVLVYFFSAFKFGHEAVLFFFVLSGFVIHLNYSNKLDTIANKIANTAVYAFKRFIRIYPALLFSILITLLCDYLGNLQYEALYSNQSLYNNINNNLTFDHSLVTLTTTLLNLSTLGFPVFGSNGPLWSLAYEWWFYILYPILYFKIKGQKHWFYILIAFLAILGYFQFFGMTFFDKIFPGMLCWSLGCLLADVYRMSKKGTLLLFSLLTFIAYCMLYLFSLPFNTDLRTALLFASFMSLSLYYAHWFSKYNILSWLGNLSYTLYIIHFPILLLYSSILMNHNEGLLPRHFWHVILGVILSLMLAYPVSRIMEYKIPGILKKKLKNNSVIAHPPTNR